MLRFVLLLLGMLTAWSIDVQTAFAQSTGDWPGFDVEFARGPGYYLNVFEVVGSWLLFLVWVYTTDWLSQDCLKHGQNYVLWNSIAVASFMVAFVLLWLIPWFWVSLLLLLAAEIAPLTVYIIQRNKQVEFAEKVLTKAHLRRVFAGVAGKLGMKVAAETPTVDEQGPNVKFKPMGGKTERDDNANLLTARQLPGYLPAKQLFFDAIDHGADSVLLDFGAQIVTVRHQIDGVWHNQQPLDRLQAGDPLLVVLKTLSGLNPADRRSKQSGVLGVETPEMKYQCRLVTQGTQAGERAVLQWEGKKLTFKSLEDIGMRQKMREQLEEHLGQKQGFLLFSSMPAGGLSTMFDVVLNSTDRYMRNYVAIDEAHSTEREVLNIEITRFDATAGESPATVLPKLIRTYPNVFVVRDLVDLESLNILLDQVRKEERMVFSTVRAKEAVEALLRVLLLKVNPADFAAVATLVLNVRLVRKLCEKCKEGYPPPGEVLKQMGLPPGRIEAFYRPPTGPIDPKHPEKVCEACQGIGYKGRTGIFELLVVDDRIRNALATQPRLDVLRDAARKSKHRTLQEEGLLLVAKGVTSLQELLRVLKQ